MKFVRKAYGYVTRIHNGASQVLVFRHPLLPIAQGGIQIPKGTVHADETPLEAVKREITEETGLTNFTVLHKIVADQWEGLHNDVHERHERHFFLLHIKDAPDEWDHVVTGIGEDEGMVFHYFWVGSPTEIEIAPGHGDHLDKVFFINH
jgi:8-oxo-dGTP pyrophosphatase MutT (NUDIX family)